MKTVSEIEISSPAGSYESLSAAIRAGANSVYFGVENLNMRSRSSSNFTFKDIHKITRLCKKCGVNSYITLNTIIYDSDIPLMKKICDEAKEAGVSAVIATDFSAIQYASSIGLPVHISVQANVSNIDAVKFFAKFADVIVLAREVSLEQIHQISSTIKREKICGPAGKLIKIEVFAHGALCVSISGKCYMSLAAYNTSANRGACFQNCRRKYRVIDEETGYEMIIDNKYVMSPKDICTIRIIDRLLEAGVSIFKIEGRGRSPDYTHTVTEAYRKAVDMCASGEFTLAKAKELEKELEKVFNRGFWHGGYYLGDKAGEWSGISGSRAGKKKTHIGHVINYFQKAGIVEIYLSAGDLSKEDEILITGPTTGAIKIKVSGIKVDEKKRFKAEKNENATIPVPEKIRRNDKVYLLSDAATIGE